jgi:hypothetical protein
MDKIDQSKLKCVVFDFAFTLCSDRYFKIGPKGVPNWRSIFEEHVFYKGSEVLDKWLSGEYNTPDIARLIQPHAGMDLTGIIQAMDKGCENLAFNTAVLDFAEAQKRIGRPIALVTGNLDVFSRVVVPCHGLDKLFDVILSSSDFGANDKLLIWPKAFEMLGHGIGYHNSLLIEDGDASVNAWRSQGGLVYQYTDDEAFTRWLTEAGLGTDGHVNGTHK